MMQIYETLIMKNLRKINKVNKKVFSMKNNRQLSTLILAVLLIFLPGLVLAAPSLDSMDGVMYNREWNGHQVKEYGNSYGDDYDVEKLGMYIDDNILYLGIQTDFNLDGGWAVHNEKYRYDEYGVEQNSNYYLDPGDFAFDFNGDGSYEAGIDFQITGRNVSFTFFEIDDPGNWGNPVDHEENAPYTAFLENYKTSQKSGTGTNEFEATISYRKYPHSQKNVLEAAINLDTLSSELNQLFQGTNKTLNLYWTMECGNDALLVSESYSYTSGSQVPEPSTMLLVGIGLLGLGVLKRKPF